MPHLSKRKTFEITKNKAKFTTKRESMEQSGYSLANTPKINIGGNINSKAFTNGNSNFQSKDYLRSLMNDSSLYRNRSNYSQTI
jgi:hypothetical protein